MFVGENAQMDKKFFSSLLGQNGPCRARSFDIGAHRAGDFVVQVLIIDNQHSKPLLPQWETLVVSFAYVNPSLTRNCTS